MGHFETDSLLFTLHAVRAAHDRKSSMDLHPRRRNVTTSIVGIKKTVTYAKIAPKMMNPSRSCWGTQKRKKKKKKKKKKKNKKNKKNKKKNGSSVNKTVLTKKKKKKKKKKK